MKHVLEPIPLLVAAVIGAIVLYLVGVYQSQNNPTNAAPNYLLLGALTGLGVQIGVRVTRVS
jgi:hypothetical protein